MEDTCVAILCGGQSKRFRSNKSLARFRQEPLISHMIGIARKISNSVFVVVSNSEQKQQIQPLIGDIRVVLDPKGYPDCPLTAALAAFKACQKQFCQLFPTDTPLLKPALIELVFQLQNNHDAVVPRWPSGYIEPLHSLYKTAAAMPKAKNLLASQSLKMRNLVNALENVLFISIEILRQADPDLDSFKNANTREELCQLEEL
ncbi:MAG: molybdenum cofactor guanylyltransferase [Candidatus Thorarchaeota archaeon]|nr:molybdenum cofactor guanylyltransferase [Candidatus Thorarchaeota archaeon]